MKKILHISKYYYPFSGGTEQIARDCVRALKNEYNQKVIAFNDNKNDQIDRIDGIEVYKCGCFAKVSAQALSFSYGKTLHMLMRSFKPDIVVFHYPNPFVATFLLKELKKKQTKLIFYWHLDIVRQKFLRILFNGQNKKLLKRANRVIATSPNYIDGSDWLQSVKDKCIVIPNCINVERMKLTSEIEKYASEIREENQEKIICLAVGRHTEYKGFSYLIAASKLLENNFKIYIIGKGELTDRLKKEAEGDNKIQFTGRVDDLVLKALIKACDIYCFPSITKNEAFGLALAEAMYYEKPTVTFTIPGSGVNYVSLNGITGIEVENRNVEKYAEAIKTLATNKKLRDKHGRAGKKRVEENFLDSQFRENIKEMVKKI